MIDFVNRLDFIRAANEFEKLAVAGIFPAVQLLFHRRQQNIAQQCRFSGTGNSGDDRKPADRETNIDILQIVRARAVNLNPMFDFA